MVTAGAFARAVDPDARDPLPKRWRGSGHRSVAPEDLAARLRPRLAAFGATRVARTTGLDRIGIECVAVARPNGRSLSVAGGKGFDRAAAWVSGVMEAAELAAAEAPTIPLRFGDPDDAAAWARPIDLARAPLRRPLPDRIGPTFWAEGRALRGGAPAAVPFELVHCCWLAETEPAAALFDGSTNGLASGAHPAEAALHGLCELAERDSLALFERLPPDGRARRRVDPASVDDPAVAGWLDRFDAAGFSAALWDVATDVGLPAFLCALADRRSPPGPPGFGSGCHPDRGVAALRAASEAAQTRLVAMAGVRDDLAPALFGPGPAARFRWSVEAAAEAASPPRRWRDAPDLAGDCLRADLRAAVARVEAAGCGPVVAVDLAPGDGVSVLRVVALGLEPAGAGGGARAARAAELLA